MSKQLVTINVPLAGELMSRRVAETDVTSNNVIVCDTVSLIHVEISLFDLEQSPVYCYYGDLSHNHWFVCVIGIILL